MNVSGDEAPDSSERGEPAARRTFLLIDDDSMVGRLLGHAAEACGCEAVRSLTMAGFQRAFHERRPDIVAVDLCVPGYDGIEILRFLAADQFRGLVLIVSGLDHRILSAALRLGSSLGLTMAEPLAKPFRLEELARRLGTRAPEPIE
jgi:two-component system, OmpR family, response regulator